LLAKFIGNSSRLRC